MAAVSDRLPVRLVPLVGRRQELADVLAALSRSRLMTLTGPGGTGKTRLALAATEAARGQFPGGVCWVELAPLADPGILAPAVAGALGVAEEPGQDAVAAIAEHVAGRSLLLVLDNCEHLAAAAAVLTDQLLAACPALCILATSRELLGVDGERSWPVPPLSLPAGGTLPPPDVLAGFDAVRFFEQRAQLVVPSFRLSGDNAAAVLQVCRRLDGLPLAIELAAARMRVLSASELADSLDDIFTVLTGGSRTAPPRHQALRATLDWSHDLLDTDERAVLRRLAVFAGGFTLATAGQVASGDGIRPGRMLELLTRLADKSLLRVDHAAAGARYHLLATVRDYARERLAEAGEEKQARQAHLRCCLALAEEAAARIEQAGQGQPGSLERELDRLDAETPNLRAALEHAHQTGDAIAALRIAGPLGRYAYLRGHYQEVRQWMDRAVTADPAAPPELRARALLGSGRLALLQCDYAQAVRRLEGALRLYRELADPHGTASALEVLGSVSREQGRYARSQELHRESLAIAESAGDPRAVASAHSYLGFASWLQGDFELATTECTTALRMFRELGDVEGIAWALLSLGTVARYQRSPERAASLLAESRALAEQIGFREGMAWALEQLGLLALDQGDDDAAGGLLLNSLGIHRELHDRWRTTSVLADLAALALARGGAPAAARLLAAAEALRETIGSVVAPCESERHAQALAGARQALGEAEFAVAWQEGLLSPLDDLTTAVAAMAGSGRADAGPGIDGGPAPAGGPAEEAASAGAAPAGAEQAGAEHTGGLRDRTGQPGAARARSPRAGGARVAQAPAASGPLQIRALGEATVLRGDVPVTAADWGYAKPRELLFLLVTSPPLTREQLGVALWPDQPGHQLGNSLHTALRGLRRALGDPDWVRYSDGRYSFNRALAHDCDVTTFETALAAARKATPASAALPELQRALAAYGGDFLAGLSAGEWAHARREELRRSYESALLATGRLHAAAGRYQPAVAAFRHAIAHEPLNETAHRELMSAWARLGETARAIRHYEELAALLQEQLGVPPSAETTALYQRLTGKP